MDSAPSSPPPSPSPRQDCKKDNTDLVEVAIVLAVLAMLLLHVLGSLRRWCSSSLVHTIVMGVYTLSYPLVSYAIGWMTASHWYYLDFPVWAVYLVLLLGSTDTLTARCLEENDDWKSICVSHLFKLFLLVYIVLSFRSPWLKPQAMLWALLVVVVVKWYVRIASMRIVSKPYLCKNMKAIAEYMQLNDNPFNPVTLEGCRYVVAGEKYCGNERPAWCCPPRYKTKKVTTLEQIWQCKGKLLRHERGKLLKDVCLSMALSKMLSRRLAGFKLSEAELEKAHRLVFQGLLAGDAKPEQRAFRVIEEELVFVHDMYYTRYNYLHQKGRCLTLCLHVIMLAICSWLIIICKRMREEDTKHHFKGLTMLITAVFLFLEAYQLYLYMASGWFKVALIRSYVTTPFLQRRCCSPLEMIIGLLLRLKGFPPWKRRLGQYCLLEEFGRKTWVRNCMNCIHYATLHLVDKKAKNKKGRRTSVKPSEVVKKAIVDSLAGSNGRLTNGVTSLRNNDVHGLLSWACDATAAATDGALTRTILVWHIATTLCEHQLDAHDKEEEAVVKRLETATTLSQYCLHLLAFAPNLLPDHSSISESILHRSIKDAGKKLKGAKTLEDRCKKLMEISSSHGGDGDEATLVVDVVQGARLARCLIEGIQDPASRWKVLSDFWVEMMLYVSPSDDARAHLEALARGGEFITHLWALLTHAGVLNRGTTGTDNVV